MQCWSTGQRCRRRFAAVMYCYRYFLVLGNVKTAMLLPFLLLTLFNECDVGSPSYHVLFTF